MKRPALYTTLIFAFGIALSNCFTVPIVYPIFFSFVFLASSYVFRKNAALAHAAFYIAVLLIGAAYYSAASLLPSDHISNAAKGCPENISLKGIVASDPILGMDSYGRKKAEFLLRSEAFLKDEAWIRADGLVNITSYSNDPVPDFGDEVVMKGTLHEISALKNPGTFDYSKYLGIKDIFCSFNIPKRGLCNVVKRHSGFSVGHLAYSFKRYVTKAIDARFDSVYGGFLKAILIGDRSDLSEKLKDDFKKTGTMHILAISGLHVGLVAAICLALFGILRVPKKIGMVTTLALLILYSLAAGANPPIIRAVVMFAIFIIGYLVNRDSDGLNTLAVAAFLMLLVNPKELFDPGFQLSFVSVGSIILFTPGINRALGTDAIKRNTLLNRLMVYLITGLSVSCAAWIGSWPFIAEYFNMVSPISIFANLFVIPALFVIMTVSFVYLSVYPLGFILPLAAWFLKMTIGVLFYVNHFMAAAPFAYFFVSRPTIWLSALYYLTVFLAFLPRKIYCVLTALLLCNIAVYGSLNTAGGRLEITFLDVGQGDSAFVRMPSGENILIDGSTGGDDERFDTGRSVIAPYLWNRGVFRIDAVIATHFHEDHIGGLIYILQNFKVGCVIDSGADVCGSVPYDKYMKTIKDKKIKRVTVRRGDVIGFSGGEARIYVLNPGAEYQLTDSNDNSLLLKLSYGNSGVLFCGDITERAMQDVGNYERFLRSDVIKIPHHGGNLGDLFKIKYFFNNVAADTAVISVGRHNRYGAPVKKTTDAILSSGATIYETKDSGSVSVFVDKSGKIEVKSLAG